MKEEKRGKWEKLNNEVEEAELRKVGKTGKRGENRTRKVKRKKHLAEERTKSNENMQERTKNN